MIIGIFVVTHDLCIRIDSFPFPSSPERASCAVQDPVKLGIELPLLQQLVLVLHEELDPLDRRRRRLRDGGRRPGEEKVLREAELFTAGGHLVFLSNVDALADGVSIRVIGDRHVGSWLQTPETQSKAHSFSGHLSWFLRLLLIMMRCLLYEATLLINFCSECTSRELEQVELVVNACGRAVGGPQSATQLSYTTYDKQDFTINENDATR